MTVLHVFRTIIWTCLFVGFTQYAAAQGTNLTFGAGPQDADLPVEITSESLSVDNDAGTALFTGNVVAVQGEMRLAGDRVTVIYNEERTEIARLEARGSVILVSGPDEAEANEADYDLTTNTVLMRGDVLTTQGLSAISSDRMQVNIEDGTATMDGNVRTILQSGTD